MMALLNVLMPQGAYHVRVNRQRCLHPRDSRSFRRCNNHTKDLSNKASVVKQLSERERDKERVRDKQARHVPLSLVETRDEIGVIASRLVSSRW